MSRELWEKVQYEPPFNYIFNGNIQEYDISKANINMLRAYNMISEEEYNSLYISDKYIREKIIGEKERENKELVKIIQNGIIEAKLSLFESNNIQNNEVVRIANDSVYVNRPILLQNTIVPLMNGYKINFALKNIFTSMLRLGKVLIFCGLNPDGGYNVDIKGISKDKHMYHQMFLSFICTIIDMIERSNKDDVLRYYHDFYQAYINMELSIEYYREFKSTSCYRIIGGSIGAEFLEEKYKENLDINYNLYVLRELYKIIMQY